VTDGNGWVSFNLSPGTYTVCEVLPAGWQPGSCLILSAAAGR